MARTNRRRERRFTTYRLLEDDYLILRDLGKNNGATDRYHALLDLVPIVRSLKMPHRRYRGLRLGIPVELDNAIREIVDSTGHNFVDVLLLAARQLYNQSGTDTVSEAS